MGLERANRAAELLTDLGVFDRELQAPGRAANLLGCQRGEHQVADRRQPRHGVLASANPDGWRIAQDD